MLNLTLPRKASFQKTSPAQLTTEQSGLVPVWTFDGILCFPGLISTPNKLNLGKLGNIVSKIRRADNASTAQLLSKGLQNSGRMDEITDTIFLERGCFGAVDRSDSNNQFVSLFAFDCKLPIGIEWNVSFSLVHS